MDPDDDPDGEDRDGGDPDWLSVPGDEETSGADDAAPGSGETPTDEGSAGDGDPPAGVDPTSEASADEDPPGEASATEDPASDASADEEPADDDPPTDASADGDPTDDGPTGDGSAGRDPTGRDRSGHDATDGAPAGSPDSDDEPPAPGSTDSDEAPTAAESAEPGSDEPAAAESPETGGDRPVAGSRTAGDDRAPAPEPSAEESPDRGPIGRFRHTDDPVIATVREIVTSVGTVVLVGVLLFGLSGVWPPLVAVESGSMEPHMHKGDLVFVMEPGRFSPGGGGDAAIVTHREGTESGYWSFGDHGNVVVYEPNGRDGTPIIHRAMFFVEEGENWVAMANESYLGGIDSCSDVASCPAQHDGYVTKGDANRAYDQAVGRSDVVRTRWIRGVSKVRVPYLGCIRLELAGNSCLS